LWSIVVFGTPQHDKSLRQGNSNIVLGQYMGANGARHQALWRPSTSRGDGELGRPRRYAARFLFFAPAVVERTPNKNRQHNEREL